MFPGLNVLTYDEPSVTGPIFPTTNLTNLRIITEFNGHRCSLDFADSFNFKMLFVPSAERLVITKTWLYNFDPLKPHFYIVKLGFTEVHIIFLFLLKTIDCGSRSNRLGEAVLTSTHNLCFEHKYEKYQSFYPKIFFFFFFFFWGKIFYIFE